MFSYYGSKNKIAKLYPLPKHDLIIEPFAGAAWYSVLHRNKNVLLNEKYEVIHNIWKWLINEASSELILEYKDFFIGQDISQIDLTKAHKDLIGFCINRGSIAPKNIVQKWSCQVAAKPNWASTTAFSLERVAKLLPEIKHWQTQFGDYKNLPDIEATWFIDPPYQFGGEHYSVNGIDYSELAEWCKTRKGQVIVCENTKANWLPFTALTEIQGQRVKTVEAVWSNEEYCQIAETRIKECGGLFFNSFQTELSNEANMENKPPTNCPHCGELVNYLNHKKHLYMNCENKIQVVKTKCCNKRNNK